MVLDIADTAFRSIRTVVGWRDEAELDSLFYQRALQLPTGFIVCSLHHGMVSVLGIVVLCCSISLNIIACSVS